MEVTYPITFDYMKAASGEIVKVKLLVIPPWDMDSVATITIAHGLTYAKILGAFGWVRQDDNAAHRSVPYVEGVSGTGPLGLSIYPSDIYLTRVAGGIFDGVFYTSTAFDRGMLIVFYIE
jgi:hypothetical protein